MSVKRVSIKSTRTKITTKSTTELKEELLKWICERHATNGPLNRKLLRDRAMELATSFGVIGFKCSEAWLTLFLKKHGFSPTLTNCSGPIFEDYRIWIDLLRPLITQYRHKDLFNVDELVMYSDFLPLGRRTRITPRHDGDKIMENHQDLSRITSQTKRIGILLCCNSSGTEKLEPLISNPYVLENTRNEKHYNRHDVSCISDEKFGDWLSKLNSKMSNLHRHILLLLSRERIRSLQNSRSLSHVKLVFFPKDFPAQLRPLRGDIFHSVKMTYRRRYVDHIRNHQSSSPWKTKDIIESIFEAWNDVSQELIVSSFQRTKFREDESFLKIECPNWDSLETGMSFRKFVTFDDELSDMTNHDCDRESRFNPSNANHYNLRRSRRETVEIDYHVVGTKDKSRRSRKIIEGRIDKDRQEIPSENRSSNVPGSSKMPRESPLEVKSRLSRIPERCSIDRSPRADQTIDSLSRIARSEDHENVNTTKKIYENPEKRRIVMERCLRGTNTPITDLREEFTSRSATKDLHGSAMGNDDIDDEGKSSIRREKVENVLEDAGPSVGKGFYDMSSEMTKDSSRPIDFNDEESAPIDDELRRKIDDAIEICDDVQSFNDKSGTNIDPGSSKRSRICSIVDEDDDDDEPTKKRSRTDNDWAKRYETNFVFGPEVKNDENEKIRESTSNEDQDQEDSHRSPMSQTGSSEIEKRSIFTLEANSNNSPSASYPKTKD